MELHNVDVKHWIDNTLLAYAQQFHYDYKVMTHFNNVIKTAIARFHFSIIIEKNNEDGVIITILSI